MQFSKVAAPFHIPSSPKLGLPFLHMFTTTCDYLSFESSHPSGGEVVAQGGYDVQKSPLLANDISNFFPSLDICLWDETNLLKEVEAATNLTLELLVASPSAAGRSQSIVREGAGWRRGRGERRKGESDWVWVPALILRTSFTFSFPVASLFNPSLDSAHQHIIVFVLTFFHLDPMIMMMTMMVLVRVLLIIISFTINFLYWSRADIQYTISFRHAS